MKNKTIPSRTNNPRPWLWPLLLVAVVTLPPLWLLPVLWARNVGDALLMAIIALPGITLASLIAGWMFRLPQQLVYQIGLKGLVVHSHEGERPLPRAQVVQAERINYRLPFRLTGNLRRQIYLPGYYAGQFDLPGHGRVKAYVADNRGEGVLLELKDGEKLLLAPQNLEDVLKMYR